MTQRDNAFRTENQQERLITIGWVLGFVDGEGCFCVGFVRQRDRIEPTRIRRGYQLGYQVFGEFAVTQGQKSRDSLVALTNFFGLGNLYINKRYDNHKEHMWRYTVRRGEELHKVIIPFFRKYPLRTAKNNDFVKFAQCMEIVRDRKHLTPDGLHKIAQIASTMNRQKPRPIIQSILRYHTPTVP